MRAREEIEIGGGRARVGAHLAAEQQVAGLEFGHREVLGNHVDAVAGGSCEHAGHAWTGTRRHRLDRIARMIVQLAAERTVHAVVEVIPPAALALCAAHHGGQAEAGGPADETPRLGDDAYPGRQLRERGANRPAEFVDRRRRMQVVDRETAADVEHGQRRQAAGGRLRDQARADFDGA